MKRWFAVLVLAMSLICVAPCGSQTPQPSTEVVHMKHRVDTRVKLVKGWESQGAQQVVLSIAVGLLGLAVGALQAPKKTWARTSSVVLGLTVSAITICTKTLYPADFQTLRRAVDQANPIIERLSDIPDDYDLATAENKVNLQAEFEASCAKIDDISHRLLGSSTSPPGKAFLADPSLFDTERVLAQSQGGSQTAPAWTTMLPYTDNTGTYYVGVGRDASLNVAKTLSLKTAYSSVANWVQHSQNYPQGTPPSTKLISIVEQDSQVANTWFVVDKSSGIWTYYSLVKVPSGFASLDIRALGSVAKLTMTGIDIKHNGKPLYSTSWRFDVFLNDRQISGIEEHNYKSEEKRRSISDWPPVPILNDNPLQIRIKGYQGGKKTAEGVKEFSPRGNAPEELDLDVSCDHKVNGDFTFHFVVTKGSS